MTLQTITVGILLGAAVLVAMLSAVGMSMMRDTLQRLHFSALVVSLSAGLIAIAVWLDEPDPQARIKALLVAALLFGTNSILTHATARAVRVHQTGCWKPQSDDRIVVVERPAEVGGHDAKRRQRR